MDGGRKRRKRRGSSVSKRYSLSFLSGHTCVHILYLFRFPSIPNLIDPWYGLFKVINYVKLSEVVIKYFMEDVRSVGSFVIAVFLL